MGRTITRAQRNSGRLMLCLLSDLALDSWLSEAIVVSMSGAALTVGVAVKRFVPATQATAEQLCELR